MELLLFLLNIVSNAIPPVAVMISGVILLALSGGILGVNWGRTAKTFSIIVGYAFLFIGFLLTVLVSILQLQKSYGLELPRLAAAISPVVSIRSGVTILVLLFVIWLVRNLVNLYREWGFKLKCDFVEDKDRANILVENIGKEILSCHARITNLIVNGESTSIKQLNPEGQFFKWDRNQTPLFLDYAILTPGIPRVLYLVYSYGGQVFLSLDYSNDSPIGYGSCEVSVEFLRLKQEHFVRFRTVKRTLVVEKEDTVGGVNMKWLTPSLISFRSHLNNIRQVLRLGT